MFIARTVGFSQQRISQFAVFVDHADSTLGFNTLTEEFLRIDIPIGDFAEVMVRGDSSQEVWDALTVGRFLVPKDHDEFQDFVISHRQKRFGPQWLILFISPTLECNASCEYCYQRFARRQGFENAGVTGPGLHQLLPFVAAKILDAKGLRVFWYGGEPLLRSKYVAQASSVLQKLAKEAGKPYSAFMVTNGLLLKGEAIDLLRQAKITDLQISLDGTEEEHNRIGRCDGQRGFKDIIGNLQQVPHDIEIGLRINVSRANLKVIPELLETLAKDGLNRPNIRIVFPPVYEFAIGKGDRVDKIDGSYILRHREYSGLHLLFLAYANQLGFNQNPRNILVTDHNQCHAIRSKGYSVWPDGSVTRCVHETSTPEGLTIEDEHFDITHVPSLQRWLLNEVFHDEPCRSCFYLPQCGGGCLHSRLLGNKPPLVCPPTKHNLEDRMRLYEALNNGQPFHLETGPDHLCRKIADFLDDVPLS